jgi:hypothetical protein
MSGAITVEIPPERREELVLAVLNSPVEQPYRLQAEQLGISSELVRQIWHGKKYSDIHPELLRLDRNAIARTCLKCVHYRHHRQKIRDRKAGTEIKLTGSCGLGIPEAAHVKFARGCEAFA